MSESQSALIAGVHFVAHKLAMLGLIPSVLHHRVPFADLLVSSPTSEVTVPIRVRTAASAANESGHEGAAHLSLRFPLQHRDLTRPADAMFFCFVDLHRASGGAPPDVYVVSATQFREGDAMPNRKYSTVYYERSWQVLQPFRNNWTRLQQALTPNPLARTDEPDAWLAPPGRVQRQFARAP